MPLSGHQALALGRKNYLFSGSDAGGDRAAVISTIVEGSVANLLLQVLATGMGSVAEKRCSRAGISIGR